MTIAMKPLDIEGVESIEATSDIRINSIDISIGDADRILELKIILVGGEEININTDLDGKSLEDLFKIKTMENLLDWLMVMSI